MKDKFPEKLLYDKDFSWVSLDDNVVKIGVNFLASTQVKEFVFIDLPKRGNNIKKGETYVSLEAIKWSGHLSSPVSGEIIDVNKDLFNNPSKLNKNPYEEWIMKVKIKDVSEIENLMDSLEAKKFYSDKID